MNRVECELLQQKFLSLFSQLSPIEKHQSPELVEKANTILEGLAKMGKRRKRHYATVNYTPVPYQEKHPALPGELGQDGTGGNGDDDVPCTDVGRPVVPIGFPAGGTSPVELSL